MSNHTSERHRLGGRVDRYGPPSSQDRAATAVTETIVMPWPMNGLGSDGELAAERPSQGASAIRVPDGDRAGDLGHAPATAQSPPVTPDSSTPCLGTHR